jgi:hypothetical protein
LCGVVEREERRVYRREKGLGLNSISNKIKQESDVTGATGTKTQATKDEKLPKTI